MELSALFSHLNSISSALHTHWNFFSVVVLGIVAGLAMKDKKVDGMVGLFLIIGLTMYLVSNFYRIGETVKEIKTVKAEINRVMVKDKKDKKVGPEFSHYYTQEQKAVNDYWPYFHITIDVFLVLMVVCQTDRSKWPARLRRLFRACDKN